jgi:hypothetical protein
VTETVKDKPEVKIEPTNKEYSKREDFIALCVAANVEPTTRQASKFRLKKGKAYNTAFQGRRIVLDADVQ